MMVTVVSGFSPSGYIKYGQRFMSDFARHWPVAIGLQMYVEEPIPAPARVQICSLWDCPGVKKFIKKHSADSRHTGHKPVPGWRPKDHANGYSYKWDAVKFCRQCFIPAQAATMLPDEDILVWLDADVVTFKDVPTGFVETLLGDADLCYLGRRTFHTELGFWAVRLNPRGREFVNALADIYRSERIFNLREWHSAFAFDQIRRSRPRLRTRDLTPGGRGHVWFQSPLARYTDHLKGDRRKQRGRSEERIAV